MRVLWLTDLHLDCLEPDRITRFVQTVGDTAADVVLVGGDTGIGETVLPLLRQIAGACAAPVHFVLGNHDYYGAAIASVRQEARRLTRSALPLFWLPEAGVVPLDTHTALIGHDGWADGRNGDYFGSPIDMNDRLFIRELRHLSLQARLEVIERLGDEAANCLEPLLSAALERFQRLLVLTHVPPFREAVVRGGRPDADDYLPHFSCRAVGERLQRAAARFPDCRITVLSGHTHFGHDARIRPNLRMICGSADYHHPRIQSVGGLDRFFS